MNFFKRLFKIGEAEANSALDKMEDPIKLTEQGIRDMKADLSKSLESLAQVKALVIRANNDSEEHANTAESYQQKAMLLLKKAQAGGLETEEADRLAKEALIKTEESKQQVARSKAEAEKFQVSVVQLEKSIKDIKQSISKWENELKTLKARVKVSDASKNINKQMSGIDSYSTVGMLERMKEKVVQDEALAEAYGEMASASKSVDQEIDQAINITEYTAEESLAKLKEQMGINKNNSTE